MHGGRPTRPRGPSQVSVKDSIVADNTAAGILGHDAALTVKGTLVEDTRPGLWSTSNPRKFAHGIKVEAVFTTKDARLLVQDSTVRRTAMGIFATGVPTTIERTVVQDTISQGSEPWLLGNGILATPPESVEEKSAALTVRDTVVDNVHYMGIGAINGPAVVERSVVRGTRTRKDQWGQESGVGVYAGPAPKPYTWTSRATLTLDDSVLVDNHRGSLLLWSSTAKVRGCSIRDTLAVDSRWGDGISAATTEENAVGPVQLTLQDSLVQGSGRAGLLLSGGGGEVRRSVLKKGVFAIVLQDGASPTVGGENVYEGNTVNEVSYDKSLTPLPQPKLPPPFK